MPSLEILLDTSTMLKVLSYHVAKEEGNTRLLQILDDAQPLYAEIDRRAGTRTLCVADMTMVEVQVTHIKNALFEYARRIHRMPPDSLYGRRTEVLNRLRGDFTRDELSPTVQRLQNLYASWGLRAKLGILPDTLTTQERISWRRRQELVFRALSEYESFEAQDAYIVASGIAAGVTTIWSADHGLRGCVSRLRNQSRKAFLAQVRAIDPALFADLDLPVAKPGP